MMCFSAKAISNENESANKTNYSFASIVNSLVDGESFYGYIKDKSDAVLVIEACRREYLPFVRERLNDFQRESIRCGSVYVFHEEESKIKRWTDGMVWTPSRNLLGFIHYREIWKNASQKYRRLKSSSTAMESNCTLQESNSLEKLYKPGGFFKKCISYELSDGIYHLISYACIVEGLYPHCRVPSSIPAFQRMKAIPVSLGTRPAYALAAITNSTGKHSECHSEQEGNPQQDPETFENPVKRQQFQHGKTERPQMLNNIHSMYALKTATPFFQGKNSYMLVEQQQENEPNFHCKERAQTPIQKVPSELDKLAMAIEATATSEKKQKNRFGILHLSRIK
jgi:hypothetical protein